MNDSAWGNLDISYSSARNTTPRDTRIMTFTNAGKVGIGVTSPDTLLHIKGGAPVFTIESDTNSTSRNWDLATERVAGGDLSFRVGTSLGATPSVTAMYFKSDGKVGIGTTSPDCPLHINGSANSEQVIITGNGNASRGLSISTAANGGQQDALVIFNAQDTGHADYPMMTFQTGGTERMRINPNGNVNIGIGGSGGDLLLQPLAKLYLDAGGNTYIVESSGDVVDFYTGGAQRMRINSTGISVTGDTINDGGLRTRGAASSEMSVTSGSNGNQTVVWRFGANAGNTIGYFVNNNNAGVYMNSGSTSWSAHSDERIKENITLLGTVLPSIDSLRCVKYNKIGDTSTNKTKIGFIAQDWESTAFSEVVDEDDGFVIDDGLVVKHDESESTTVLKGISYTETIPVLLKAIQELKAENTALKARVTALE